ncbi:MAG TPA: putative S-layer protein [Candidatus Nanoarchaeia archaeon]|nr:putative S-layer protein [Candidatus Nanoarchaeia archaeon]
MKSKIFAISLLALFLVGIVSAVSYTVSPTSLTFTPSTNSTQFTITNTNSSALLNVNVPSQIQLTGENGYIAIFNVNPSGSVTGINSTRIVVITPASDIEFSNFNLEETYTGVLNITEQGNPNNSKTVNLVLQNAFCEAGEVGSLRADIDITNKGQYGEEDEWYAFEEIEVEVTIENVGNDDIDDVVVSWGLYNKRTGEFILDDEENQVNVNEDDEEIVTFTFTVDPEDLAEADSEDDYVLYVKAYSDDLGEDEQCDFVSQDISILRDDHFVILDDDISLPSSAQCSETVQASVTTWNIGDSNEDDIYVIVSNRELGLNKRVEIGDLDVFEDEKTSFEFDIPQNATEKSYVLDFRVYDEDDDVYENDNNDESFLTKSLTVSGSCTAKQSVDISSSLDSSAVAGQELTIRSTLRNTGTTATSYQVIVTGYDSWSTLQNVEPRTLTLQGGESKDVTITLIPNRGVSGDNDITVQALYNGLITEQKITVPVSASSGGFGTGFSIANITGGSWFIWVIAALNVILVVLIIVIAIRIARK